MLTQGNHQREILCELVSLLARQVVLVSQLHVERAQIEVRPERVHQEEEGQIQELMRSGLFIE